MTTVISDVLLGVLGQALADAIGYRERIADQDQADAYRGAALVLGVRLEA